MMNTDFIPNKNKANTKKITLALGTLFTSFFLPYSPAVFASDNTGFERFTKNDEQTPIADVIHVTSQKRIENIQDVPISISVVKPDELDRIGYRQLTDIAELIPNMRMTITNDFTSIISLRGVGAASRNIGFDSRVGLYLDGVYLGQSIANNHDIFDLQRIEVLRGPQGTFFGKNNVAGAIHFISKELDNEFSGRFAVTAGNFGLNQYTAVINTPITDTLSAKFSVNNYQRDGLIENIVTGNDINEQDNQSYRAQLAGELSDNLSFNLSFDYLTSARLSFDGEPITDTLGRAINTEAPQRNKVSFNLDPFEKRKIGGAILTVDWQLDNGFLVKSITGQRDNRIEYVNDFDFSQDDIAFFDYLDDYQQFSQELQFISPEGKFQYVAGLYYYQQDAYTKRQPNVGDAAITLFTGIEREQIELGASLGDPQAQFLLGAFNPGILDTEGTVDTTGYALFFNGNYQVSDTLTINVGFRFSEEKKEVDWLISSIDENTGIPVIPALGLANGEIIDERRDNDFSPLVSLNYQINDDVNSYIKYATGYKSGGYNVDFLTQDQFDAGIDFDKETVETLEFGIKGYAFQQDLMFRSAIFYSQYDDFQVNQLVKLDSGAAALSVRNAAKVETKGAELELVYFIEQFELMASLGLLDAEFEQFKNGGLNGEDLSGNSLPEVPDYTYNLGFKYHTKWSLIKSDITLSMNYNYRDDYNSDLDGITEIPLANGSTLDVGHIEGYGLLNMAIDVKPENSDLKIVLWANNLADEDSPVMLGKKSFFGARRNVYVDPKMYGVTAQYAF